MKIYQTLAFLILTTCNIFAQQSSLIIPNYTGSNVNALSSITTNGSYSSTSHFFNSSLYSNFQHTCQNAWFENGNLLFYVISGIDLSSGNKHTLVYNTNGILIADVNDLAVNEIGLFKVSCSFFHVIVNKNIYMLILEPFNGNSSGGMVLGGTLPNGHHNNIDKNPSCNGKINGGTSIAISKPVIDVNNAINNYYTVYYIADFSGGGFKQAELAKCNVYYNNNTYVNSLGNNTIHFPTPVAVKLRLMNDPFHYSNIGELELSPDQTKVAYIDFNEVNVFDLNTNTTTTYDVANNYPNNGTWFDCTNYFRGQPCGLEFSASSNDLAISFFDVFSTGWPANFDAIISWNLTSGIATSIVGTAKYANSFIEMGQDLNYYAVGKNITNNSYIIKIDPITLLSLEIPFSTNLNRNFKSFNCNIPSCFNPMNNFLMESVFYTLPDQIDGMNYSYFNTDNCCSLPIGLFTQLDDQYIVNSNETWENNDIMYKNVTVLSGATLTIKNCTINFKENAKMIIELGGKLLVDNAKLTNECNALWPGIEIKGNVNLPHTINAQGFVHLFNNAIIEHAEQAVLVSPAAILFAQSGSKILNCLNGVKFQSCPNILDNLSFLQDVTFECSTLIPTQITGTLKFLEFTGINWAGVYGCTFKNTLSYAILDANNRGCGIDINNSNIGLHQTHNVFNPAINCFNQTGNYNNFSRLTSGVIAIGSPHIVIDYAEFYDCQTSVEIYASGESHITNSIFTLDQNYVYIPRPFQDFIILSSVNGYHVSQNTFNWHEPLWVYNGINGLRIDGTSLQIPSNGGEIRNNIFSYNNHSLPGLFPDITGIYMNTELDNIKVEWNVFNDLTIDWLLTSICRIQDQTMGGECFDPHNSWSQAPHTIFHILNNGLIFKYCSFLANQSTTLNPEYPTISYCFNITNPLGAVGNVGQNLITCSYPPFDAGWGINSPIKVPTINEGITLLPNPIGINQQHISYELKEKEVILELTIYNLEGKQILKRFNQPSSGTINISECNLSEGIYYLQVMTSNAVLSQKFLVK